MLPYFLDDTDIAIIKSLMKDGRKSFRQISREIKVSTPTIKFHFQRLVNLGVIKCVMPIIDMSKIDRSNKQQLEQLAVKTDYAKIELEKNTPIEVYCDLCKRKVGEHPPILRIGDYERFFCCESCKGIYQEKYSGRIRSLIKKFQKVKESSLPSICITGSLFATCLVCMKYEMPSIMHSIF